ncbi:sensor histidine kinase [Egibacter rhizosphaerae]|uniref:histidine kinase n=1 Tax=Egibacter rhizosphaerae TaxID=1670831 RepID=A0A411YC74_9ACTN|nr:sensor histidine kinase [Egibacter rhizosphaerae]QBI18853.1 sensor histidine kinase [Egibacter rhizosphaerae]
MACGADERGQGLVGYPGGPVTVVLMAAIYVVAAAGQRRWAWLAAALFAGGGAVFRAVVEGDPLVSIALNSALFVLVALLGDAVYSRRALRQEVQARLRQVDVEREREAQRRVIDERMRIARELHDVMAHTIATVTVQAGVATDSLDDRSEDTRTALQTIRGSARQAMAELRATVSVLRDGDDPSPLAPAPALADLPALVESAGQDGLRIDLHAAAAGDALPATTELTAYRIVQEAVTNVIRHAGATSAVITVDQRGGQLEIIVDDDGRGSDGTGSVGYGLQGMRERAEAVGGRLHAGPRADGGFRVHAHLPTAGPGS